MISRLRSYLSGTQGILPLLPALFGLTLTLVCSAVQSAPGKRTALAAKVDFNRDVRPILAANCFACHGQDPSTRQVGLRLDVRELATAFRSGGRAIEPG